jgi:dTDP-4-dehydrorhamnose reductase
MKPLLVFGAKGQIASELIDLAGSRAIECVGLTHEAADITDPAALAAALRDIRPRLVVNAAAYTAVDRAESEEPLAHLVNAVGAGNIAKAAAEAEIPLIHLSTDYVFDGSKPAPYLETDPIAPLGAYGRTKAEGEAKVRAANPRHIILRTAWVYGRFGHNFLKTMLRLAREREELRIVADQVGCPTATQDIAEAILAIDQAIQNGENRFGTYHFAGSTAATWHEFASSIVETQAKTTGLRPAVTAITTADYPTPARRPANSRLDSSLFTDVFGYRAQDWRTRTSETISALIDQGQAGA